MIITNSEIFLRIIISLLLGGIIGFEREGVNRPAGFRTHILVCVGSALVMITGIYLLDTYKNITSFDPTRLGAQVVSGIGFLGAGTILKEGLTVKGLTTAASLWAVAAIGIACGSGFYLGAIITTFIILISLVVFNKIDNKIYSKNKHEFWIEIVCENKPGLIAKIGTCLDKINVQIKQISLEDYDNKVIVKLFIKTPRNLEKIEIFDNIKSIDGIKTIN